MELKIYDSTVLHPYNFAAMCVLEHGLPYYPESMRIKSLLLKLYGKLGLSRTVTSICKNMQVRPDQGIYNQTKDHEKLGAHRFSCVSSYGQQTLLQDLVEEYNTYFPKQVLDNKNNIVQKYLKRNFEEIHPLVQVAEQYEHNVLWQHF